MAEGEIGAAAAGAPPWRISVLRRWLRLRTGGRVLGGPFRGLRLGPLASNRRLGHTLMLGTYEFEIQPSIEQVLAECEPLVVNVGAAQGYYAAGIGLRLATGRIIAYEQDREMRRRLDEVLRANALGQEVEVRGRCGARELEEAVGASRGACLVLMDIEGGEDRLLEPSLTPSLSGARILVEVHEHLVPGLRRRLEERFRETHRIATREPRRRGREDVPAADLVTACYLAAFGAGALLSEHRPPGDCWMDMTPLADRS